MSQAERPQVLYVEDDPASRVLVRRILTAEGNHIECVEDGVKLREYKLAVERGLIAQVLPLERYVALGQAYASIARHQRQADHK